MDVIIDGVAGFQFATPPVDVLDAISIVSNDLRSRGRAILSLSRNGENIKPDMLVKVLSGKTLEDVSSLAVYSEAVDVLVDSCLKEIEQVLPELPEVCHRLAEVFQGESPEAGFAPFERLAVIWQTIKEREIQAFDALAIDIASIDIAGEPLSRIHDELNQYINEAAEALKAGDCILLGDLLEYELAPRAETEVAIVKLLRSKVSG
jgi:hypothetical protein